MTLYTGVRLMRFTEVVANFDEAGGRGLSDGLGLAAYVNADAIDPRWVAPSICLAPLSTTP